MLARLCNIEGVIALKRKFRPGSKTRRENAYRDNYYPLQFDHAKEFLSEISDNNLKSTEVCNNHFGIGLVYLEKNQWKQALKNFEQSLNHAIEYLEGKDKILIADIKDKIAEVLEKQENKERAKKMYREAFKIREEVCEEYDLDVARSFYNKERLEKYRRSFRKALKGDDSILSQFKIKDQPCQEKAKTYKKIARIHLFLKDNNQALSYYERALNEYKNFDKTWMQTTGDIREKIDKLQKIPRVKDRNNISNISSAPRTSKIQQGNRL